MEQRLKINKPLIPQLVHKLIIFWHCLGDARYPPISLL